MSTSAAMNDSLRAKDSPPGETFQRRSSDILPMVTVLVVGTVMGTTVTASLLYADILGPWFHTGDNVFVPILGVLGAALALVVPLAWWIAQRLLKGARGTLEQVISETTDATRAVTQGTAPAAVSHAERAVQNDKLEAQTKILGQQGEKLDLQTVMTEAQRRGELCTQLFSILGTISTISSLPGEAGGPQLSQDLIARIVAFSRFATPYWTSEVLPEDPTPRRADRPRSPERGQLLVGLSLSRIDISKIQGVTFEGADLREANLFRANLFRANLREADLNRADLSDANLGGANLGGANLSTADLGGADLRNADLGGANLSTADLGGADLRNADLSGANLRNADLSEANLGGVNLSEAIVGSFPLERSPDWLPSGWEVFDDKGIARLRRSGVPSIPP
jgi:pentapeptide repeat protein